MTPDIADIIAGELKVSRWTAYDMMREALAEAQPQQESVEWIEPTPDFYISELSRNTIRFHNAVHGRQEFSKKPLNECIVSVWFTLPPAQRKPLTDEQIDAAVKAWFENDIVAGRNPFKKRMCAAIEAAHGIKEQP